jgi:hypothetical protein
MNFSLRFTPLEPKTYQFQFPVAIRYSAKPYMVTVTGIGVRLQLVFEPSTLVLPPVQPLGGCSTETVTVRNPTNQPIEFYSLQFDHQLLTEETIDPRSTESPFVTYTPKAKTPIVASTFAVCIIVTGPPFSGKSSVSQVLSSRFKLPIVDLSELWATTIEDHLGVLYTHLSNPIYRTGCIIDGLCYRDDHSEKDDEVFLLQCFKQKNISEDITKPIPVVVQHTQQSSLEKALEIVLSALDGHYVFHISLRISTAEATNRFELKTRRERMDKINQKI